MKYEELIQQAAGLGYTQAPNKNTTDPNRTLAEVVISRDQELWEAFPVMMANAGEAGGLDAKTVLYYLEGHEKENFKALALLSAALYGDLKLRFGWLKPAIAGFARGAIGEYQARFRENAPIRIGRETLQPQALRARFLASYARAGERFRAEAAARSEVGLEYAMGRIFAPKQKQLFLKKLRGDNLTKTEREYFSRVIRKKLQALANPELHRLAARALE